MSDPFGLILRVLYIGFPIKGVRIMISDSLVPLWAATDEFSSLSNPERFDNGERKKSRKLHPNMDRTSPATDNIWTHFGSDIKKFGQNVRIVIVHTGHFRTKSVSVRIGHTSVYATLLPHRNRTIRYMKPVYGFVRYSKPSCIPSRMASNPESLRPFLYGPNCIRLRTGRWLRALEFPVPSLLTWHHKYAVPPTVHPPEYQPIDGDGDLGLIRRSLPAKP
ncbi:hypothetical protein B0H19DRAFT_1057176 [Mycena capillaripes]|nr:hypothetical protein B0H19DRAFT_1057176 [Mycena capillaripes]